MPQPDPILGQLNRFSYERSITMTIFKKSVCFFTIDFINYSFHLQVNFHHLVGAFRVIIFGLNYFIYFSSIFYFDHHDVILCE